MVVSVCKGRENKKREMGGEEAERRGKHLSKTERGYASEYKLSK